MKRIGILTFHRSINYGAFMQAYALSHEIKKRFPNNEVEIIDFELLFRHNRYKHTTHVIPFYFENKIRYNAFKKDLVKLPLSPKTIISNSNKDITNYIKERYNIVIVGSDAVWAFKKMKLDNPYWLFGNNLKDVVKISYAASAYSTDFRNVTDEEKQFIRNQLDSFSYIGVRDCETQNFIKEIIPQKKIHLNNDPTFFLEKAVNVHNAYEVLKRNFIPSKKPFVTLMTRRMPYIEELKRHIGNKYTFIHTYHRNHPKDVFDIKTRLLFNLSPLEWYNIFCISTINISHYFHGTLLGIVNNIPTISIDDTDFPYKYIGKNEQVMFDLKLNDYFFRAKDLKNLRDEKDRLFNSIDYALTNLETERSRLKKAKELEVRKSESFFSSLESLL